MDFTLRCSRCVQSEVRAVLQRKGRANALSCAAGLRCAAQHVRHLLRLRPGVGEELLERWTEVVEPGLAAAGATQGSTTVSTEALNWGLWHFGEFSRAYRDSFGELPSDTLRRKPGEVQT